MPRLSPVETTLLCLHEYMQYVFKNLSDFMDNSTGFIHLQHAAVRVWAEANAQSFDDVLLNPQRVVGVIETGQPSQSEPAVAS